MSSGRTWKKPFSSTYPLLWKYFLVLFDTLTFIIFSNNINYILKNTTFLYTFLNFFYFSNIINMNNKIPEEDKKIKISISIDPNLNKQVEELLKNKFYKKSRFIEYLIKKYIEENDN